MENCSWVNGKEEFGVNYTNKTRCSSGSGDLLEDQSGFSAKFDIFPITLACLIVGMNLTVMVLFICNRALKTVTNSFLVSLAVSDLLAGLIGVPLSISCSVFRDNKFCPPSQLIWRFISVSTVLHILLVSVDRYIAIKYAIRYHNIVTRHVFLAFTSLAWATATFVSFIQLSWREYASLDDEDDSEDTNSAQTIYELTVFVVFFAVPLCIMAFTYNRIFFTVRYHERQIWRYHCPSDLEQAQHTHHNKAQRRTAIIFLAMLIVFIICWFPYFILSFQERFDDTDSLSAWVIYVVYYYPRYFTSLSNPMLYVLGKRDFREALLQAVRRTNTGRNEIRGSTTLTALHAAEQNGGALTNT